MSLNKLGSWPVDPHAARESGELFVIKRDDVLRTIHGEDHPVSINFFISTDFGHMAEIIMPSGGYGPRASDILEHGSDSMIYCLEGPITVFTPDTRDTFLIQNEESILIPASTKYQVLNYGSTVIKGLLTVGPKL